MVLYYANFEQVFCDWHYLVCLIKMVTLIFFEMNKGENNNVVHATVSDYIRHSKCLYFKSILTLSVVGYTWKLSKSWWNTEAFRGYKDQIKTLEHLKFVK